MLLSRLVSMLLNCFYCSVKKEMWYFSVQGGKLMFCDKGGFENRNASTMWCISEADKKYNWKGFGKINIHSENAYEFRC